MRPQYVFVAAAKVGGILANATYPADFVYQNLMIQANVIHSAFETSVQKLLFLGSSCIYPKLASQPICETALLTGKLEPTNEAYAIAKIAGLKMCEAYCTQYGCNFIGAMPTNLYGYHDNFHSENSHVIPGMIHRFHNAKIENASTVTCWGTGSPQREFLFVDDLAEAAVFLMDNFDGPGFLNVGTGEDIAISDLADLIANTVGYEGEILWDSSKPDGTPRKVLDISRLQALGWQYRVTLEQGLESTYDWYCRNCN
jgi:GDP-L-fucose synthase